MISLETTNFLSAVATLGFQVVVVLLFALYFFQKKSSVLLDLSQSIGRSALWLGFILSLGASALTLYYSEILGIVPCGLCWVQRVFLYPQVILFGIAAWKKDHHIALYSLTLSILGAIVAFYQHYLQMGGSELFGCPTTIATAGCEVRTVFEFGYITFPLMSATLFVGLIVLMLIVRSVRARLSMLG